MSEVNFKRLSKEMSDGGGAASFTILFVVVALVGALFVWANYAELDNVTRGDGRVISSLQNQMVQASEGGVILKRHVSENSIVKAGDLLFEIDPINAIGELNPILQRINSLKIREERLRSEILGKFFFQIPSELSALAPVVAQSEKSLFDALRAELKGEVGVLRQSLSQSEQDIRSGGLAAASAQRTMDLLSEEISFMEPLVKENIAPATQLLGLQREFESATAMKDRAISTIEQGKLSIEKINKQIKNVEGSYILKSMEDLNRVVAEQSELAKALPSLEDRVSRTLIKAPIDGIINKINFRTPGGFVKTGDLVLELVPTGEALIIEAKIQLKDISRIRVDDEVRIRFSAYDSSKFGHVLGRVSRISPDAVIDKATNMATHYLIKVAIEGELVINDVAVEFMPGLTATVDVLSGKRTVFEYLWEPVSKIAELALRD
ncbi:HlyD family type I secretion periplasmic adaptor subunit [Amylibacter sp.]|nr:HlyD family type I secretion periplasmic adaptor subunit [Amylibacter sp.]